jgi:hypothetical protein
VTDVSVRQVPWATPSSPAQKQQIIVGNDDARICLTDAMGDFILSCTDATDHGRQCDRLICLTDAVGNSVLSCTETTDRGRRDRGICLTDICLIDAVGNSVLSCTKTTDHVSNVTDASV